MLAMHRGLVRVLGGDSGSKAGEGGGDDDDDLESSLSAKQAKGVSNVNKNNMLKLLKFTSSVPWHEPLVEALTELGAKEKAEKNRDISADAAVAVRPAKRPLSPQVDREGDRGKRAHYMEVESQPYTDRGPHAS